LGKKKLATFSWSLGLIILITGGLATLAVAQEWQSVGLWERLAIGTFFVWLAWFSLKLKWIVYYEII
jgi:hypothetical protein